MDIKFTYMNGNSDNCLKETCRAWIFGPLWQPVAFLSRRMLNDMEKLNSFYHNALPRGYTVREDNEEEESRKSLQLLTATTAPLKNDIDSIGFDDANYAEAETEVNHHAKEMMMKKVKETTKCGRRQFASSCPRIVCYIL